MTLFQRYTQNNIYYVLAGDVFVDNNPCYDNNSRLCSMANLEKLSN